MEMEIDDAPNNNKMTTTTTTTTNEIKAEELFKAAESGDTSVFQSLISQQQVLPHDILSLRNEDQRSLLHVAVSSASTQVLH